MMDQNAIYSISKVKMHICYVFRFCDYIDRRILLSNMQLLNYFEKSIQRSNKVFDMDANRMVEQIITLVNEQLRFVEYKYTNRVCVLV